MSDVELDRSPASLANRLFGFLDTRGVPYAALGDPRSYTRDPSTDVDLVVDNESTARLPGIVWDFCRENDARLVQVLQHEQTAWYFVLAWRDTADELRFLPVDFCGDYLRNGRLLLRADDLLAGRRPLSADGAGSPPYVPEPRMAFLYYLIKKIDKGDLGESHFQYLSATGQADEENARREVKRLWSGEDARRITDALASGDWGPVVARVPALRSALHRRRRTELRHAFGEGRRILERVARPSGLCVALLGPDGSGKTTVIRRLVTSLAPAFRKTGSLHLRPRFGRRRSPPPTSYPPCRGRPRGLVSSLAKLVYWWIDYTVGFAIGVVPSLVRGGLVIFDRYYLDLYIDTERYRYGGPEWFARLVGRAIVQPEMFIVLDAPAEVLTARKGELSRDEADRHRRAYRALAGRSSRFELVDASRSVESSLIAVETIILECMESRTARRLGLTP